jgi:predicted  nucleic acid-binding Zn-ribbon protein
MLKEAQAKRTHATKECSQLNKALELLQTENAQLKSRLRDEEDKCDGEKYRWEELRFLNKQLSSELEELRAENESLAQKLRYSTEVLEHKYQ